MTDPAPRRRRNRTSTRRALVFKLRPGDVLNFGVLTKGVLHVRLPPWVSVEYVRRVKKSGK